MTAERKRVGVLVSGRGSNLQALIAAAQAPDYPAEIALVISNRPEAKGLEHARAAGIAARVIDHKDFATRADFDGALIEALAAADVELIALAGFMRLFTPGFVAHWHDRMINIHPSLLPLFPGLDPHGQALAAGVKLHGCTVHFVRDATDSGPIVGQAAVPVLPGDTAESLAARVLRAEHQLYPRCLRLVAEGRIRVEGEQAVIMTEAAESQAGPLINPPE